MRFPLMSVVQPVGGLQTCLPPAMLWRAGRATPQFTQWVCTTLESPLSC
jgi:hypothetical protein